MEAILKFNLPEETIEHKDALNGTDYKIALCDIDKMLRDKDKYVEFNTEEGRDLIEQIRREFHDIVEHLNYME